MNHLDLRKQADLPLNTDVQILNAKGEPWDLAAEGYVTLEISRRLGKSKELTNTLTITKPVTNQWHLGIITINTSLPFVLNELYLIKLLMDTGIVLAVGYLKQYDNSYFIEEKPPFTVPAASTDHYEEDDECGCSDCGTITGIPDNSVLISDVVDELLGE